MLEGNSRDSHSKRLSIHSLAAESHGQNGLDNHRNIRANSLDHYKFISQRCVVKGAQGFMRSVLDFSLLSTRSEKAGSLGSAFKTSSV